MKKHYLISIIKFYKHNPVYTYEYGTYGTYNEALEYLHSCVQGVIDFSSLIDSDMDYHDFEYSVILFTIDNISKVSHSFYDYKGGVINECNC